MAVKVSIKRYRLAPLSAGPHHRLPIPFFSTVSRVLRGNSKDLQVGIFPEKSLRIDAVFSFLPLSSFSLLPCKFRESDDESPSSGLLTAAKRSGKKKKKLRKYVPRNISRELSKKLPLLSLSFFFFSSFVSHEDPRFLIARKLVIARETA